MQEAVEHKNEDIANRQADALRGQTEAMKSHFAGFHAEFSQRLGDALQRLALADESRSKELKEQRSRLARQEEKLAQERRELEATRQKLESGQEKIQIELAATRAELDQRATVLDRQARAIAEGENALNAMKATMEGEHHQRERSLQNERRRLSVLKNELEIREARARDQASQLIRLCQRIARLGDSVEGSGATSELVALAKRISSTIDKPGRAARPTGLCVAEDDTLQESLAGGGLESPSAGPVRSNPNN